MRRRHFLRGLPLLSVLGAAALGTTSGRASSSTPSSAPTSLPFGCAPGTLADLHHGHPLAVMEAVLPATPAQVFAALAAPEPWPAWLWMVQQVRYLDDRRGPGCERDVTVAGGGIIREHFLRWTPGERFTFWVTSTTSPLLALFMEDYLLRPVDGGQTRLRWTVRLSLRAPWAGLTPLATQLFQAEGARALPRLAAWLSR